MPGGQLTLLAGPSLKKEISNFSRQLAATNGTYVVNQDAESKKITLISQYRYEGDFGNVAVLFLLCSLTEQAEVTQLTQMQVS